MLEMLMLILRTLLLFICCFGALSFERAVSTLPSLTQVFSYLEVENKLVGVSHFCHLKKPKIGDSYQLNFEKLMTLKPDIVYLSPYVNPKKLSLLEHAQIKYKIISQGRLDDIFRSVETIGKDMNLPMDVLDNKIKKLKKHFEKKVINSSLKKGIVIVGDDISLGKFKKLYVAAKKSVYQDLLATLSIMNIAAKDEKPNIQWNMERVYKENPPLIIQLLSNKSKIEDYKKLWMKHSGLEAVKRRQVYFLQDEKYFVTGPQIYKLFEKMKNVLSGEDKCCSL